MNIISIDAETNALWGIPFAVAAIVYENEKEVDRFVARISSENVTDQWVKDNVLPTLDFPETHGSYESMLLDFSEFYIRHKNATALWHMGHVVESFLFRECVRLGFIGQWDAPYTPIEVSEHLRQKGYSPDSVDSYAKEQLLPLPKGSTHNPLYDCEVAARVFFHLNQTNYVVGIHG